MTQPTILIIGTYDTKDDELRFIQDVIHDQGGGTLTMDVSVLKDPKSPTDITKHKVAETATTTIDSIIALDDENTAMQAMALGASRLASDAHSEGKIDGVIILGGSMGTDLALDVCLALPLGVPKYIVSTVAFSPLLPPDRIAADVQMILWAGGLYGLNSICKASLSQAAGAVLGAARAARNTNSQRPMVGMTSFGKTIMTYMVRLKPELEDRGYEVAVFHPTGMGGRAFEDLAAKGAFTCVLDFATQEVGNHLFGSSVSAGADRLTNAGLNGTPQIVAPGCHDLIDLPGWQPLDTRWDGYDAHAHNRLLSSIVLNLEDRKTVALAHAECLNKAVSKTAFVMPLKGCHEWERKGEPLHDPKGPETFANAIKPKLKDDIAWHELDCHINDDAGNSSWQPLLQFAEQSMMVPSNTTSPDGHSIVPTFQTCRLGRSATLATTVSPATLKVTAPSDSGSPDPQCSTITV